jgi:protein ImuA
MIAQLRQKLQTLERPAGIDSDPGCQPLGTEAVDAALGGGLARGALHEISAAGEVHLTAATGFALAVSSGAARKSTVWIAEDMALTESGAPYGPGLETFSLSPERLLTVAAARTRDLLWAMEEALRCRAVAAVIGELRHGEIDMVAVRRLSLAAAGSGALALLLRASPPNDASTAATRWIVSAASNDSFAVELMRNRRGPRGAWTLQWSDDDERFVLATHAQPVAAPAADRPHRKIA